MRDRRCTAQSPGHSHQIFSIASGRASRVSPPSQTRALPDSPQIILALVGMPGAGKSTVGALLREVYGWPVVHLGEAILDEVQRLGLPPGEDSERRVRTNLRRGLGDEYLLRLAAPTILGCLPDGPTIVDSLARPSEIAYLRTLSESTVLVAVCAGATLRRRRLLERFDRPVSPSGVARRDEEEAQARGHTIALANHYIVNSGDKRQLAAQVTDLAEKYGKQEPGSRALPGLGETPR